VIQHGEGGGLRGGGNAKLEQFVAATLRSAASAEMNQLAAQYQGRLRESQLVQAASPDAGTAPGTGHASALANVPPPGQPLAKTTAPATAEPVGAKPAGGATTESPPATPTTVVGAKKLSPMPPPGTNEAGEQPAVRKWPLAAALAGIALLLGLGGFFFRKGMP
jgi:hypothetical protein